MPWLVLKYPQDMESVYELTGEKVTLGRNKNNRIVVSNSFISGYHVEFIPQDSGEWEIVDLGSHNGVFVNEVRVRQAPLAEGDRLKIGIVEGFFTEVAPKKSARVLKVKPPKPLTPPPPKGFSDSGDTQAIDIPATKEGAPGPDEAEVAALKDEHDKLERLVSAIRTDLGELEKKIAVESGRYTELSGRAKEEAKRIEELEAGKLRLLKKSEKLEKEAGELRRETEELAPRAGELRREVEELGPRGEELRGQVEALEAARDNAVKEAEREAKQAAKLKSEAEREVDKLAARAASLGEEVAALEERRVSEVDAAGRIAKEGEARKATLEDEAANLESEADKLRSGMASLQADGKSAREKFEEEMEAAARRKQKAEEELASLEAARDGLKDEIAGAESGFEEQLGEKRRIEDETTLLSGRLEEVAAKVEEREADIDALEEKRKKLLAGIETLEDRKKDETAALRKLEHQRAREEDMASEAERRRSDAESAAAELQEVTGDIESTRARLEGLRVQESESETKLAQLRQGAKESEKQRQNADDRARELGSRLEALQSQCETREQAIQALAGELTGREDRRAELAGLEGRIAKKRKELKKAEGKLAESEAKSGGLEEVEKELSRQRKTMDETLENLRTAEASLASARKALVETEAANAAEASKLAARREELERAGKELKKLEKAVASRDEAGTRLAALRSEIQDAESHLSRIETEAMRKQDVLRMNIAAFEKERREMKGKLDAMNAAVREARAERASPGPEDGHAVAAKENLRQVMEEIASAKAELRRHRDAIAKSREDRTHLKPERVETAREAAAPPAVAPRGSAPLAVRVEALEARLGEKNAESVRLRAEIATLRGRARAEEAGRPGNGNGNGNGGGISQHAVALKDRLARRDDEIERLKGVVDSLRRNLERAEKDGPRAAPTLGSIEARAMRIELPEPAAPSPVETPASTPDVPPERVPLTVLDLEGGLPDRDFTEGQIDPDALHSRFTGLLGFAACGGGSWRSTTGAAIDTDYPVLVLVGSDLDAALEAVELLKIRERTVLVASRFGGRDHTAGTPGEASGFQQFLRILNKVDGVLALSPELEKLYQSMSLERPCLRQSPPWPVGEDRWDFARPLEEREGILLHPNIDPGQAEAVSNIAAARKAPVLRLPADSPPGMASGPVGERMDAGMSYRRYLDVLAQQRVCIAGVDPEGVQSPETGDVLLTGGVLVNGATALDCLAFPDAAGPLDNHRLETVLTQLLEDDGFFRSHADQALKRARDEISFPAAAARLAAFLQRIVS